MLQGTHPYVHCASRDEVVAAQVQPRDFTQYKETTSALLHGLLCNAPSRRWTVLEALAFVDQHIRPQTPRVRNSPGREHLLTYTNKRTQTQKALPTYTVDPIAD